MKFKIDENLPVEVVKLLEDNGHDAVSVFQQNLSGTLDKRIAEVCQEEKRALITLDTDFSDIRTYSPDEFFGLIVLRLKRQDKPHVLSVVSRLINILLREPLDRRLWIVEEGRVRISGGDDDSKNQITSG
jgi:predicted nuclease of predicted toxin-antitoxin system